MFVEYWGITHSPFESRGPRSFDFRCDQHDEAMCRLLYIAERRRSCGLLSGPAGVGKSWTLRAVQRQLRHSMTTRVSIDVTGMDAGELITEISTALGTAPRRHDTISMLWRRVSDAVEGRSRAHQQTVFLLDSLDGATDSAQAAIERLLTMADQPGCDLTLLGAASEPRMSPVLMRWQAQCGMRVELAAWSPAEVGEYLRQSLRQAGCAHEPFSDSACRAIADLSNGLPRRVTQLAHLCMLAAMSEGRHHIDQDLVRDVAGESSGTASMVANEWDSPSTRADEVELAPLS